MTLSVQASSSSKGEQMKILNIVIFKISFELNLPELRTKSRLMVMSNIAEQFNAKKFYDRKRFPGRESGVSKSKLITKSMLWVFC